MFNKEHKCECGAAVWLSLSLTRCSCGKIYNCFGQPMREGANYDDDGPDDIPFGPYDGGWEPEAGY